MRNRYEKILKKHFRDAVIRFRQDNALTQDQMAQRLGISLRCYCNLESGKSCCSSVTLMMYLHICEDPGKFVEEMRREIGAEMAEMS